MSSHSSRHLKLELRQWLPTQIIGFVEQVNIKSIHGVLTCTLNVFVNTRSHVCLIVFTGQTRGFSLSNLANSYLLYHHVLCHDILPFQWYSQLSLEYGANVKFDQKVPHLSSSSHLIHIRCTKRTPNLLLHLYTQFKTNFLN